MTTDATEHQQRGISMDKDLRRRLIAELLELDSGESLVTWGSEWKIAVLQRGWVYVGRFSRSGDECLLTDAACIRVWGTTKGLGEIAANGPTSKTVLDPCPDVRFHVLTAVLLLDCASEKWASR